MTLPRPRLLDWLLYSGVATIFITTAVTSSAFAAMPFLAIGAIVALGSGVAMVIRTVVQRDQRAAVLAVAAAGVLVAAFFGVYPARKLVRHLEFLSVKNELEELKGAVLRAKGVKSLRAGIGDTRFLNGIWVREGRPPQSAAGKSETWQHPLELQQVLDHDGISRASYEGLVQGLHRAGYYQITVFDGFIMFTESGMLDLRWGVLWVRPGHAPPAHGRSAGAIGYNFISVYPLSGGWYAYTVG